jgi:hypothetical protein
MPKLKIKDDKLRILQAKIHISRKRMESEKPLWNKCRDLFEGNHFSKEQAKQGWKTINLVWAAFRTQLSSLYVKNPTFSLKPNKPEAEVAKGVCEAVLNYYVKRACLKANARLAVQSALTDIGILHWGCDTDFKEGIPDKDSFYFQHIKAERFFPDHSAETQIFKDLPGFGILEYMKTDEVQRRYNIKEVDLRPTDSCIDLKEFREEYDDADNDLNDSVLNEFKRIAVYKYYDNEDQKMYTFSPSHDEFFDVRDYEGPPPYAVLKFNERSKGFYPLPDIIQLKDTQLMIEIGMSMLGEHMKKAARKQQVKKGALDGDARRALEDPGAGVIVERNTDSPIVPIDFGSIDSSIFGNIQFMEGFFNQIAGSAASQRGGGQKKLTATAEALAEQYTQYRSTDRQILISDFMKDVGNGFYNCLQANLTLPDVIQVTDPQGGSNWFRFMPDNIYGDYECEVMIGDTAPQDDILERAQWIDCLSVLQSNPLILMSPLLIDETLKRFNIDSKRLRDELVKLGQAMYTQQMGGGQGAGTSTPSNRGNVAGSMVKI